MKTERCLLRLEALLPILSDCLYDFLLTVGLELSERRVEVLEVGFTGNHPLDPLIGKDHLVILLGNTFPYHQEAKTAVFNEEFIGESGQELLLSR